MADYIFLGSGTTDSNGLAVLPDGYTGTGAGEVDVVASLDDPDSISDSSLQSEPYPVYDCIVFDDMETEKFNIYKFNNNANISYSNEWSITGNSLKWDYDKTGATNTKYWGWEYATTPTTDVFDVALVKGKSVRLEMDIHSEVNFSDANNSGFYIQVFYKTPSQTSWGILTTGAKIYSNTTHYQIDMNVPSDCTDLWVRINANSNCPSGIMYTDNWKIYPI